ncbi:hypothetical protein EYF80_006548 [Liparis tanakae]|uniref:Uncharacterized protein n=1 Tax=Liparis tanakae TaxID=230148 RepID=A0A4Z2IYZ0_9TELE|nr:hypothetical protein EYF80_006548 [Liparis tanakae]
MNSKWPWEKTFPLHISDVSRKVSFQTAIFYKNLPYDNGKRKIRQVDPRSEESNKKDKDGWIFSSNASYCRTTGAGRSF